MTSSGRVRRSERGETAFVGRGGRRPRVLAHGGSSDRSLAVDEKYLYWSDREDGHICRIPKGGGVPMVLAEAYRPRALIVADGMLYWAQMDKAAGPFEARGCGSVARMPVEGGTTPEVIVSDLPSPFALAVSGEELAIGCWGPSAFRGEGPVDGSVVRAKVTGEGVTTVASKQREPRSLLFVDDDLYWTNFGMKRPHYFADGALMRTTRAPGKKRWVVHKDQSMAHSLVADDAFIYWTVAATIYPPHRLGAIWRRPRGGGPTSAVVTWKQEGGRIAVDASHVYWMSDGVGTMYRIDKTGGEPEPMMTCESRIMICHHVLVDEQCVYWCVSDASEAGGAIWAMAKEPLGVEPHGSASADTLN